MHHSGEPFAVGEPPDEVAYGVPVRDVAGEHPHPGAEGGQLGRQFGRPVGVGAAPADQGQRVDPPSGDQVPGEQAAEGAGAAGDERGAARRPAPSGAGRPSGPHQPPGVRAGGPQRHLILAGFAAEQPAQPGYGVRVDRPGQVDETAPAVRVFGAQHSAEAPEQGLVGFDGGVAGVDGGGLAGGDPEPGGDSGVAERLGEGDRVGEPERHGGAVRVGPGREAEQRQHGLRRGDVGEVAGELGAPGAGRHGQHPYAGCGERGRPLGRRPVLLGGHDEEEVADVGPAAVGECLPADPVAPGVEGGLALLPASPGGEGGQHVGEGRVGVDGEGGGERGDVLVLDDLPERRVVGVAAVAAAAGVEPVAPVVEGVGGQVDGAGLLAGGGEPGGPVDPGAGDVQPRKGGGQGGGVVLVAAQRRDVVHRAVGGGFGGHGGEGGVRADLQERGDAQGVQGGDAVSEPHRLAHVPHPVLRPGDLGRVGELTGQVRHDRQTRGVPVQALHDRTEIGQHRLHQPRMKRVTHRQPLDPPAPLDTLPRESVQLDDRAGQHHRPRPVHRRHINRNRSHVGRDRRVVTGRGEEVPDLFLRRGDGEHPTTSRQRLHQRTTSRHQRAGVLQREHPGHVRGGHLTDRMAGQIVGRDTPRRQQLVQGHLDREQPRLRVDGLVQQHREVAARLGEHHLPQRTVEPALEQGAHPIERLREHREPAIQVPAHARALRTLTGEQQRPPTRGDRAGDQARRGPALGKRGQAGQQTVPARGDHHRPMLQGRPRGRQRPTDVNGRQVLVLIDVPGQARRLTGQGLRRPRRHQPRHHRQIDHRRVRRRHRLGFRRFEDHVRVRAGDTERRHRRPTRPLRHRPRPRLGHQADRA
ncbi:hypothetical protein B0E53_06490 [Micromonospora sp. MH33]|nr:hypothetical protein B0E53_06490 [Micromonospora sp. MH33]